MEYFALRAKHEHWNHVISKLTNIKCVDKINDIPIKPFDNVKIIPLGIDEMISYNNDKRLLFRSSIETMNTLNDKCLFSCFMMEHFPKNYPRVFYIDSKNIKYLCKNKDNAQKRGDKTKMIMKYNTYYAGIGTKIVYDFNCNRKNVVITQYLDHDEYYVGHFFVMNGEIKKQIYFRAKTNEPDFILKCPITKNCIECIGDIKNLSNFDVFSGIFQKLNYSGFACADFIILNKTIIIFEINPRPGGSLFEREDICKDFFDFITR